jgi:endonuclease G
VIYTDYKNDFFLESHGIATPDYFWRVLKVESNVISWYNNLYFRLIPNTNDLGMLADYIVSINEIEFLLNDGIGPIAINQNLKGFVSSFNWSCNNKSFMKKSKKNSRKRKRKTLDIYNNEDLK